MNAYAESITRKDIIQKDKENVYLEVVNGQRKELKENTKLISVLQEMSVEQKELIEIKRIVLEKNEKELNIAKELINKLIREKSENKKS
jgi:hypothetical protein